MAKYSEPATYGEEPLRLACWLQPPASSAEIASFLGGTVPEELRDLWETTAEANLFVDVDYGQWGLRLVRPSESVRLTQTYARNTPGAQKDDVVFGEFLGDAELLVLGANNELLVARPLDDRDEWPRPAGSIAESLARFREAHGDKFWE